VHRRAAAERALAAGHESEAVEAEREVVEVGAALGDKGAKAVDEPGRRRAFVRALRYLQGRLLGDLGGMREDLDLALRLHDQDEPEERLAIKQPCARKGRGQTLGLVGEQRSRLDAEPRASQS